ALAAALVIMGVKHGEHRYLRALLLTASLTAVVVLGGRAIQLELITAQASAVTTLENFAGVALTDETPPDIYLLVLDGYGRADVLADMYDFDNTPFLELLTSQGFQVAPQATA